jgi:hypothetical protein
LVKTAAGIFVLPECDADSATLMVLPLPPIE